MMVVGGGWRDRVFVAQVAGEGTARPHDEQWRGLTFVHSLVV